MVSNHSLAFHVTLPLDMRRAAAIPEPQISLDASRRTVSARPLVSMGRAIVHRAATRHAAASTSSATVVYPLRTCQTMSLTEAVLHCNCDVAVG